ncbi:MAG: hypothetical protein DWQ04_04205 [Chloroflexi bacterium]|nr:MAG: hypothetical protein DWQ04_04205 [Chloroflexota bacterium]
MLITFNFRLGQNILTAQNALSGATNYDLVLVTPKPTNDSDAPSDSEDTVETETPPETHTPDAPAEPDENSEAETPSAPGAPSSTNDSSEPDNESDQAGDNSTGGLYWLEPYFDETTNTNQLRLRDGKEESNNGVYSLDKAKEVKIVTIDVTARMPGPNGLETTWETLSFHPDHRRALGRMFGETPRNRATALYVPLVFNAANQTNGPAIAEALITKLSVTQKKDVVPTDPLRALLKGGNDGTRPTGAEYEGDDNDNSGLKAFENIADISIVAAPGSTVDLNSGQAQLITSHLISHCERMRYRIAVLDSVKGKLVSDVQKWRGQIDSKHAALYYPWVTTLDPITGEEINLPPSGFVAGIYARNDVEKGVHKAPANEVVRLAIGFEKLLNKAQQDVLNPEGINCFRFFDGRGYRLWGARTISSDPEWKYVNLRRYFAYLERSIELGTQWVVFENNDHRLWAKVRRTVEDFLYNEWKSGHLFGEKPEEAYFVRCDLSTMTQNDLDNGRLVCLIGVAPVRPAEFVIFRIGQWTAERRS